MTSFSICPWRFVQWGHEMCWFLIVVYCLVDHTFLRASFPFCLPAFSALLQNMKYIFTLQNLGYGSECVSSLNFLKLSRTHEWFYRILPNQQDIQQDVKVCFARPLQKLKTTSTSQAIKTRLSSNDMKRKSSAVEVNNRVK